MFLGMCQWDIGVPYLGISVPDLKITFKKLLSTRRKAFIFSSASSLLSFNSKAVSSLRLHTNLRRINFVRPLVTE